MPCMIVHRIGIVNRNRHLVFHIAYSNHPKESKTVIYGSPERVTPFIHVQGGVTCLTRPLTVE